MTTATRRPDAPMPFRQQRDAPIRSAYDRVFERRAARPARFQAGTGLVETAHRCDLADAERRTLHEITGPERR